MKTKIVYCLISDETDYYYEQLLISLVSLRKHNPDAIVNIVCDYVTYETLKDTRTGVFHYSDEVIRIDVPSGWNKIQRSRYLKTNLRTTITGDFLYIDTDTIICSSLEIVDSFIFDVGAVYDSHVAHPIPAKAKHETEKWIKGEADKVGKCITGLWHFNGGLMYVKDCHSTYQLYKRWYELYKEHQSKGSMVDQLPLMLANKELGEIIVPINPVMNCQVIWDEGKSILRDAKVIHYFPGQGHFVLSSPWILNPIKDTGRISSSIQKIIEDPYSFFDRDSKIVWGDAAALCNTPLVAAYGKNKKVFNRIISFVRICHNLKNKIWKNPLNKRKQ